MAVIVGVALPTPANGKDEGDTAPKFTFALIGDLGYNDEEESQFEDLLADLGRDDSLAFVVHVGDLSSPKRACTNELLERRLAQFRASPHPFVYTPGDNEWTDCHRVSGGEPLERLAKLREIFFDGSVTLGQRTFALARQSESGDALFARYRENTRWEFGGVMFLTLHVTGSNNGLGRTPEGDEEYRERNQANLVWLRQGFEHAKASNSRAVMVLQQANPFPEFPPFSGSPKDSSGFDGLRRALQTETAAFGRPVVLVHGDSHFFRIDKPLSPRSKRSPRGNSTFVNFTRVETFGSPYHHWVHVTVDPSDPNVFIFRPVTVVANVSAQP